MHVHTGAPHLFNFPSNFGISWTEINRYAAELFIMQSNLFYFENSRN